MDNHDLKQVCMLHIAYWILQVYIYVLLRTTPRGGGMLIYNHLS